jgi:hypothetical protein
VLPPSRGRLNAGAFAPSAKEAGADWGSADSAGFATETLPRGGFSAAGVAAVFGALMVRGADFPGLGDFNFFDGALWDAFAVALPVCLFFVLLGLAAVAPRVFDGVVFTDLADWARIAFLAVVGLEDFLRVFLDIRLPFVAFRGSIIKLSRQAGIEQTESDGLGVSLQGIRRTTIRALNVLLLGRMTSNAIR